MAGADVTRTLAIKIVGDTKPLSKGLSKLGKIAAGAAVGGLIAVGYAAIEGVKAFRAEQSIIKAFTRTVKNMGLPVAKATRVMDRMADRAVNLGFDDAETIQGMSAFVKLTGDIDKAARLTALAFDIARSKGIDLAAAQKIAAGIYKGNARALKDYGLAGVEGMEAVRKAAAKERRQAAQWAKDHPLEVGIGKIGDAWADLVGNFANANFEEAGVALGKLGAAVNEVLFGREGKGKWKGHHKNGLVDEFGEFGQQLAASLAAVDWGKAIGDGIKAGVDALSTAGDNGTLSRLAIIGGAIMAALFAADLAVTALTSLFSVPKLLVKGVIGAIGKVGIAIAAQMFGAQVVVDATAGALAGNIAKASGAKLVTGAATAAGESLGGIIARGIMNAAATAAAAAAANTEFADPGRSTALIQRYREKYNLTDAEVAELMKVAGSGMGNLGRVGAAINEILRKRKGGHAFGTAGSPGGVRWVGERGPELMNLRPTTQVLNSRASVAAMGGGSTVVNVNVQAAVGADGYRTGAEIARYLDQWLSRGNSFRYRVAGGTT